MNLSFNYPMSLSLAIFSHFLVATAQKPQNNFIEYSHLPASYEYRRKTNKFSFQKVDQQSLFKFSLRKPTKGKKNGWKTLTKDIDSCCTDNVMQIFNLVSSYMFKQELHGYNNVRAPFPCIQTKVNMLNNYTKNWKISFGFDSFFFLVQFSVL